MSRQIRLFLKPHTFLHETALRPHETSESDHRNHRSPEWLKTTVRVRSSLLESSSNARLWGGALHDDTKNRCVTHYVHMNPEKLCRFKKWSDSCEHGLSLGGRCSFEAYSGTHKRIPCVPGGIRVWGCFMGRSVALHKKPLERSSCELQIRRLHKQHSGPTQSFLTHDLICIWSFFSVLTIFIDFYFLWEISYPDSGTRAKNRANKNRRGLGRAALTNPPHFIARPTFGFRPRFTMWTLANKLVLNFVVCVASLRLWKDSMQFLCVENNIDNNYSPHCRWLVVPIYGATTRRGKYSPPANDTEVNNCFSTN